MTTFKNGEKTATVSFDMHSNTYITTRGISGDESDEGNMQFFGMRDYKTEKAAIKAAMAWIA